MASCLGAAQPLLPLITNAIDGVFHGVIPTTHGVIPTTPDDCEYVYETDYNTSHETECTDGWSKVCHTTYKNDCADTIENSCWKEYAPECTETPSQQCVTKKEPTEKEVCAPEASVECGKDGHDCKDSQKEVCRQVKRYDSVTTCYDITIHNCQTIGREVCKATPETKCNLVPDGQACRDVPIKSCKKKAKQTTQLSQKCKPKAGVGAWGKK